ncbi:MAG: alanine dehydrogenase [Ignavibacteriales bacterium]|nr:alanine dehydrogenase [Ignavibacteriales bacterium]
MRIGIPKEVLLEEKRVALAPAGVDALINSGHSVYIESEAGIESHFSDEDYRKVGGTIVYSSEEVFHRAELIAKIAPLTNEEAKLLNESQIVFSFLNLAISNREMVSTIIKNKVTTIAYELIEKDGYKPIVHVVGEISGQVAIRVGGRFLGADYPNSRGILLGGVTGVAPAAVVIIGAGVVGFNAARTALGVGAQVILLDKDINKLRMVENSLGKIITTVAANPYTIARGVKFADLLICAARFDKDKTKFIVTEEMVKTMKKGSLIIDVSIDQGGSVETSRPTSISHPVFEKHNVIHYCVPNMPALVPRTGTYALTNAVIEFILKIANNGFSNSVIGDHGLANAVCTYNGYCTNELIAETFNQEFKRLHLFSKN